MKGLVRETYLVNTVLSDGTDLVEASFIGQPDERKNGRSLRGTVQTVFVWVIDACDIVHVDRGLVGKCDLQDV